MKDFKQMVTLMTAKQIIEAMIAGIRNEHVKLDTQTFGKYENGICYGCVATNFLCELYGKTFQGEEINEREKRADFLGCGVRFISNLEEAINGLRFGRVRWYNDYADSIGIALIIQPSHFKLLPITDDVIHKRESYTLEEALYSFQLLADYNDGERL